MELLLLAYIYFCVCVSAESIQETNEANPKLLTNLQNFETCLVNFVIHNDKIIRTEDSRAMGAKYISESDVNTREECLRMCCVKDTCDVFVFEEKRPGSCYLFNCGSADDFKCKFTKHHNYTSGILTMEHQMTVAQEQDMPSKHEQELNQLRRPEVASPNGVNMTFGVNPQSQPPPLETLQKSNKTEEPSPVKARQCSRFQFKCRTSGECIGIYNACDGIAQCADASDEAPELGCPTPVTSTQVPPVPSSGNKTEQEESLPRPFENSFHIHPQTIPLPELKNVEIDMQSEQTMGIGHRNPALELSHIHHLQMPVSPNNILKEPEINHMSPPEYQNVHPQTRFKKPDEPSERIPSPEYSGFRQFLSPHREQEIQKLEDERNYIAVQLMAERNRDAERTVYNHKPQDINVQSHMKPSYLQPQQDIAELNEHRELNEHKEHIVPFQNVEQAPKTRPPSQIEMNQQQSGLASALRHQLTNIHLSDMQPEMHQKEHVENKETKFSLRNQALNPHLTRLGSQDMNPEKTGGQSEIHVEVDNEHQVRNNVKDQPQAPYQEPSLQEVPDRSYKYEDEDRHIFNHKGYGLVAESDNSEIPYRIAVPSVQYKLNPAQSNGIIMNNMPEYGNKMQRNMWEEQIRPTSHVLKVLKNTPQPVEVDSRYHLPPPDYLYDEGQHSILNTMSLLQHHPNSDHHASSLRTSQGHIGGPLERTNLRETQSHRDLSHDSVNKLMVMNNQREVAIDQEVPAKQEDSIYEKEKQMIASAATTLTTNTAEDTKEKHEEIHEEKHEEKHEDKHEEKHDEKHEEKHEKKHEEKHELKHEEKHSEHSISLQQAYISELPSDEQQARPSGAVLSMTFGLCITFVMVVLVACRLRVVKRRLRRNGKSLYAHDADYLVNGMYL